MMERKRINSVLRRRRWEKTNGEMGEEWIGGRRREGREGEKKEGKDKEVEEDLAV